MKSENIEEIVNAITEVMAMASKVDKSLTVGVGKSAYKGVADADVKELLQPLLQSAGLSVVPVDYEYQTSFSTYTKEYNGQFKELTQTFVDCKATYLLMHKSGQYVYIKGLGHGVDSADKAAGKATTYALKNALLYIFLIPTGAIDDTDKTHSLDHGNRMTKDKDKDNKPWLNKGTEAFSNAKKAINQGYTIADIRKKYKVSKEVEQLLND